jgi:hypothetical protein
MTASISFFIFQLAAFQEVSQWNVCIYSLSPPSQLCAQPIFLVCYFKILSVYEPHNVELISVERRIGKDLEGNRCGLIDVLSWHLSSRTEEHHKNRQ